MNTEAIDKKIERACASQLPEDGLDLYLSLRGAELYYNLSDSGEIQLYDADEQSVPGIVCFMSASDPRLMEPYAKMTWEAMLAMLIGLPDEAMIVLSAKSDAWVGVSQEAAHFILSGSSDNTELNERVIKACSTQRDEDFYDFFTHAYDSYVYFPVVGDEQRSVKIAQANNNLNVIVFYLEAPEDSACDSVLWQDALQLVLANQSVDGAIVQSTSKENIAISKEKLAQLAMFYDQWLEQVNE